MPASESTSTSRRVRRLLYRPLPGSRRRALPRPVPVGMRPGRSCGTLRRMPPGSLHPLPCPDGYVVRAVPGVAAAKAYTCPGCHGRIVAGSGHAVAWPDGLVQMRRHWHASCWRVEVAGGGPAGWR